MPKRQRDFTLGSGNVFAFMVCAAILFRDVPEVTVGWSPYVWTTIRDSPLFGIASVLTFTLAFRSTYRWRSSRSSITTSPDRHVTR
jgi:hypothetical protein